MKRTHHVLLFVALLTTTALACNAITSNSVSEPSPTDDDARTPTPAPQSESLPEATQVEYLSFLEGMTLTSPIDGGGIRPVLAWEPVEEADRYGVYLYAPSGDLYWTWQGRESSVPVGGRPQLRPDAPGPSVAEEMSWVVIAFDVEQIPIASGGPRPIAP